MKRQTEVSQQQQRQSLTMGALVVVVIIALRVGRIDSIVGPLHANA